MCTLTIKTSRPLLHCTPRMSAAGLTWSLGWLLKHHSSLGNLSSQRQKTWRYPHYRYLKEMPRLVTLMDKPDHGCRISNQRAAS